MVIANVARGVTGVAHEISASRGVTGIAHEISACSLIAWGVAAKHPNGRICAVAIWPLSS